MRSIRTTNKRRRNKAERRAWHDAAWTVRTWIDEAAGIAVDRLRLTLDPGLHVGFMVTFDPGTARTEAEPIAADQFYRLQTARGSGRTWRQIETLPDGGIYFVAHTAERRHCQGILVDQGRHYDALRIVPLTDHEFVERSVRGMHGTPYDIDHAVFDLASTRDIEHLEHVTKGYLDQ